MGIAQTPDIQLGPHRIETERLLLLVVGAHLRAEIGDRPLAYMLREEIERRLRARFGDDAPLDPVVCSDVWRLNDESVSACPTVSIGGPGVNALSAFLGDKLASVFVVEDQLIIQADLEWNDLSVCVWGMDHRHTIAAVQAFADRYLDAFLDASIAKVEEDL